jgi:hypothetical protein
LTIPDGDQLTSVRCHKRAISDDAIGGGRRWELPEQLAGIYIEYRRGVTGRNHQAPALIDERDREGPIQVTTEFSDTLSCSHVANDNAPVRMNRRTGFSIFFHNDGKLIVR